MRHLPEVVQAGQRDRRPKANASLPMERRAEQPILHLQRTIGNQAVQRLLQSGTLQPKLAISQPDDAYEREADRVAEQVMRMPEPSLQRACAPCAANAIPCPNCDTEEEQPVQRRMDAALETSDGSVPEGFPQSLGPGQPLDRATRAFFEPRFGVDFGAVRIHTDTHAAASARAINALAYTVGRDVVFNSGQYAPQSDSGKRLLAHELTHVVQQKAGHCATLQRQVATESAITKEYAAALSNQELEQQGRILTARASGLDPSHREYDAVGASLLILLNEKAKRSRAMPAKGSPLIDLIKKCSAAGLLDPPFRPLTVAPLPPLPVTQQQAEQMGAAAGVAIAGAPLLMPPEFAPPAGPVPFRPPLRLVPPPEPVAPPVPLVPPAWLGPAIVVAILLWPSETAPPWMDEMNPITGEPYSSPEEYQWVWRLNTEQRDYLRRLADARRLAPDPSLDQDPSPTDLPTPAAKPKPKEEEEPAGCITREVPRLGGYPRHDAYATKVSGSRYDYYVQTPIRIAINYDGLKPPTVVWEVKVGHGWFFNPDYASLRDLTLAKWDAQKSVGMVVASACGFLHLWTIPDRWVASLLNARWGGMPPVLNIPE